MSNKDYVKVGITVMYFVLRSQFTVNVDAFHFLYKFRRDVSILIGSFL